LFPAHAGLETQGYLQVIPFRSARTDEKLLDRLLAAVARSLAATQLAAVGVARVDDTLDAP